MTERFVYTIQSNDVFADGQRRYVNIETHHDTLQALSDELRGGPVVVEQLFTRKTDEGVVLEITGRRDLLLTWHYVFNAYAPTGKRFVEYLDPTEDADR